MSYVLWQMLSGMFALAIGLATTVSFIWVVGKFADWLERR